MRQANLYKVTVHLSEGHHWDLNIVSIHIREITILESIHNATELHITLIQENYETVNDNFLMRILPGGKEFHNK